jgi:hypothetical protein
MKKKIELEDGVYISIQYETLHAHVVCNGEEEYDNSYINRDYLDWEHDLIWTNLD